MMQFNPSMVGEVQHGIDVALAKLQRRYPARAMYLVREKGDIANEAWLRILPKYSANRGASVKVAHMKAESVGIRKDNPKFKNAGGPLAAFAYRVTFNVAMDFLRGRSICNDDSKPDSYLDKTEFSVHTDHEFTLHDVIPDHAPSVVDMIHDNQADAYLNCAIADLSPSARLPLHREAMGIPLDNTQRQAKMRAINSITANIPKSLRNGKRSKAKGKARK